jgi:hypothetical protein
MTELTRLHNAFAVGDQHMSNGWVLIPNPQDYNLQPGVPMPELGVGRYALSMYHQLHCLVSLVPFRCERYDSVVYNLYSEQCETCTGDL